MKRFSTLLMVILAFSAMKAESYLDSAYYGFEDESQWQFQHADSFEISTTTVAVGSQALRCHTSVLLGGNVKIQGKPTLTESQFEFPAGTYLLKMKVYKPMGSSITSVNTNLSAPNPAFQAITWDVSAIETDKWVTMTQALTLVAQDSTTSKINIQLNAGQGPGEIYIDNLQILSSPPIARPEGEILHPYYYGVESADVANGEITGNASATSWYFAQSDYFSFTDTTANSGDYSLQMHIEDNSLLTGTTNLACNVGSSVGPDSAFVTLMAGDYEMKINVLLEGDVPSELQTNIGKTPEPFQAIKWDLSSVNKGEWKELTQVVTLESTTGTQLALKIFKGKIQATGSFTMFIDDMSLIKTTATSIAKTETISARIFPNPASDLVNIEAEAGSSINIYTIDGKLVKSITNASALTSISTRRFINGIYFVKIENTSGRTIEKLQVK